MQVDLYDGCETGGWFGGLVAKRHHIHMVQRCSLSLLKFCGLCVCVCVCLCVCLSDIRMHCAKTHEPIAMSFGAWSRVGPTNRVLGVVFDPPGVGGTSMRCDPCQNSFTIYF